MILSR